MEQFRSRDFWKQAEIQLRKDLGKREWEIFVAQAGDSTVKIKDTIQTLNQERDEAGKNHGSPKVKMGDGELFEYNIGRILMHLELLFQVVHSTMPFVPPLEIYVWITFRIIFNYFHIHRKACEFLSSVVDRISHAISIYEVCAKRSLLEEVKIAFGIVEVIPTVDSEDPHFS